MLCVRFSSAFLRTCVSVKAVSIRLNCNVWIKLSVFLGTCVFVNAVTLTCKFSDWEKNPVLLLKLVCLYTDRATKLGNFLENVDSKQFQWTKYVHHVLCCHGNGILTDILITKLSNFVLTLKHPSGVHLDPRHTFWSIIWTFFIGRKKSFRDFVSQCLLYLLLRFYEDWYNTVEAIKKVRDQSVWGLNGPQPKSAGFETNFWV